MHNFSLVNVEVLSPTSRIFGSVLGFEAVTNETPKSVCFQFAGKSQNTTFGDESLRFSKVDF